MTTRKPKLRFLSALLAMAMMLTLLPTAAFAAAGDTFSDENGVQYKVNADEATVSVTGYTGSATTVNIPATITDPSDSSGKEYQVTEIGYQAFYSSASNSNKSSITSIALPDSLTSIASYAFKSCTSLEMISIPESVTSIGSYAFSSSLKSIHIPNSVTSLSSSVFRNCLSLESVTFGDSIQLATIPDYAFASCKSLTSLVLPSSVKTIESQAFDTCSSLTALTLPEGLESIGKWVFADTNLQELTIPSTVTTIDSNAFQYSNFTGSNASILRYNGTPEKWKNFGLSSLTAEMRYPHTITFHTNNATATIPSQTVYDDEYVAEPTAPTKEGYLFDGWYTDDITYETKFEFDETGKSVTAVNGNLDLYAKWVSNIRTVAFDMNGHGTQITSVTVNHGGQLSKPAEPSEYGYAFGGWYTDRNCTTAFNFDAKITTDITLYAKWTPNTYKVTFQTDDATVYHETSVIYQNTVAAPADPVKAGHTFGGWYTDKEHTKKFNFSTPIERDTALYADWTTNEYVLTIDLGDDSDDTRYLYGEPVTVPAPKKTGSPFIGWTTDPINLKLTENADGSVRFTMPASNVTLTAQWSTDNCTVRFDTSGYDADLSLVVAYGKTVEQPTDPKAVGYTFGGWYTDKECTKAFDFETPITADTILYAKWTANSYTVTVDLGDGTPVKTQYVYDTLVTIDVPETVGATFTGWKTEPKGLKLTLNADGKYTFTMPANDITLTAKWSTNAYTVTFDANGHGTSLTTNVAYGEPVEKPSAPTTDGYTFGGWYTDKDCSKAFDFNTPITADIVLYAKWTKDAKPSEPDLKTYSVLVFDGETEVDGALVSEAKAGETVTIRLLSEAVPGGQEFDHWEALPETLELKDASAAETTFVMPEEAVTLRAVYRDVVVTPAKPNTASVVAATAIVGTGVVLVGWTAYNIGTELYAKWVLPAGTEMPSTRGELAILLWQDAGSPEPAAVVENMTDTEKAAQWAVETGLMAENKDTGFAPEKKVGKLEVFLTLKKAEALK